MIPGLLLEKDLAFSTKVIESREEHPDDSVEFIDLKYDVLLQALPKRTEFQDGTVAEL
jgi:hypothetical protein